MCSLSPRSQSSHFHRPQLVFLKKIRLYEEHVLYFVCKNRVNISLKVVSCVQLENKEEIIPHSLRQLSSHGQRVDLFHYRMPIKGSNGSQNANQLSVTVQQYTS
ncbi:hypothetical protein L1987_43693 [Smallanthus sonchifolius]|uniref:Uncharacterized protein n=1 Tax=Smallanthus sonchifolius TaxID=185202 RepID=A0ACB9GNC3_9ASTR|nr:hypothetical protein L1987_43693 [Smallanthus sonchifolius]